MTTVTERTAIVLPTVDEVADVLRSGDGLRAGYSTNAANGRRERLWLSPECIQAHQDVLDFTEATA